MNRASYAHKPRTLPERILDRLRVLARRNGDRIITHRNDGSYFLVDAESGGLVWPDTITASGTGASLAELRDYIEGGSR